jgi:fused signal recognition particle receptor
MFGSLKDKLLGVKKNWSGGLASLFGASDVDEDFWEDLEGTLLSGDVSIELVEEMISELRMFCRRKNIKKTEDLFAYFVDMLVEKLQSVKGMGEELDLRGDPSVIILVGVNGSGKTTTAGKLAAKFQREGKQVIFAASDTFRAAAVDQLKVWGEKTGVRVVAQQQGSDSAAIAYDAIQASKASDTNVVIVDTAGRLHSKHNLMEELSKIYRVISREIPEEDIEVLLVLDAVMGQNGFRQAEAFNEILRLTGVVLSKYDNTAKGGIILTIADKLALPVRYIGLGEAEEDLSPFDSRDFVEALLNHNPTQDSSL